MFLTAKAVSFVYHYLEIICKVSIIKLSVHLNEMWLAEHSIFKSCNELPKWALMEVHAPNSQEWHHLNVGHFSYLAIKCHFTWHDLCHCNLTSLGICVKSTHPVNASARLIQNLLPEEKTLLKSWIHQIKKANSHANGMHLACWVTESTVVGYRK